MSLNLTNEEIDLIIDRINEWEDGSGSNLVNDTKEGCPYINDFGNFIYRLKTQEERRDICLKYG